MSVHVLAHVLDVPRLARADYVGFSEGTWLRQFAVAAALVVGVIMALAFLPAAHDWAHWAALHHPEDH